MTIDTNSSKDNNSNRPVKLMWLAESPTGNFVIAAGLRQSTADATKFNGYVVKLNANTGEKIWAFDVPNDDGTLAGDRSGKLRKSIKVG